LRKKLPITILLFLFACTPSGAVEPSPTGPPIAARTDAGITLFGPTPMPTLEIPLLTDGLPVISPENAALLAMLVRWGTGGANQLAWSPDGNSITAATFVGIVFFDAQTLTQIGSIPADDEVRTLAYSSDGSVLAYTARERIHLYSLSGGAPMREWIAHDDRIVSLSFSPDGTLLASGSFDRTVKIWRVSDGTLLQSTTEQRATWMDISPDGALLAAISQPFGELLLWRLSDGMMLYKWDNFSSAVMDVKFSPDGTFLAANNIDGMVQFWGIP
jgi:WD40 repeat protein